MKINVNIPDKLVSEVRHSSHGKNITASLSIALNEWVSSQHISQLNDAVQARPLEFPEAFSAERFREINRASL